MIVPVYNGEEVLPKCLEGIFSSEFKDLEVIVVNDGSTDESARIATEKGATVIPSERPRSGPAAARNEAANRANGDILVFVDADVVVAPDAFGRIARAFDEERGISALFGSYDDEPGETNFLSQYRNLLHHYVHQTSGRDASTFWAGLGAVRRDVFLENGGFDAVQFEVPSIEDIEFGARIRRAGHRILLLKDVRGKHLKRWSPWSVLRTDILCRAFPWSKLILTREGLMNDMNLKTSDRLSAGLVGFAALLVPFLFWEPLLVVPLLAVLVGVVILNRRLFGFYYRKKGLIFTFGAFFWQLAYFFYSGVTFAVCWVLYALPRLLSLGKRRDADGTGQIN